MRKHILTGLFLLTASLCIDAAPLQICGGGINQIAAPIPLGAFIKVAFTPRCSNNVILSGEDKSTFYAAAAASVKGRNVYVGSTAFGDMVVYSVQCASADVCTATDVSQGQTTASAISS